MTVRALYLSYDGALDPLGRSQVVPCVVGLADRGHVLDLLTFEKPAAWADHDAREEMRDRLHDRGIRWHALFYHKHPPVVGTARDLWAGTRRALAVARERGVQLVHARSYPSALIASRLRRRTCLPFLFDMRGLYAEERVDAGLWSEGGWLYRLTRSLEGRFLRDAAAVVTLTRASVPHVRARMDASGSSATLAVIPTAVDLDRFELRPGRGDRGAPVFAYFGSIGTWYLLDQMLVLGLCLVEEVRGARLLFLTNQPPGPVLEQAAAAGIPPDRLEVRSVLHEDVPAALSAATATFHLIAPAPSKIASAATKFGESMALGLPVLLNEGVGDAAEIVRSEEVGVVVEGFDEASYRRAARRLASLCEDPGVADRCRAVAREHFDLERAVNAYDRLYREIVP